MRRDTTQDKTNYEMQVTSLPPQAPTGLGPPNLNASNLGFVITTGSLCAEEEGACTSLPGGDEEGTRTIEREGRLFVLGERGAR